MKLGSLKSTTSRDGEFIVVSKDNQRAIRAGHIAPSLREAVENWKVCKPKLEALSKQLNEDVGKDAFELDHAKLHSPLPRSFQWADASAFIHHIKLVRMSRNAPLPENLTTVPL